MKYTFGPKRDEDGYFWLLGRVDDVMNVSGHRLSTTEIESALASHPAVAEAAVVGIPDERWGEVCVAVVALRGGATASEQELRDHCRASLAAFKVPKAVSLVDALPRSSVGKVLKDELRALFHPEHSR